MLTYVDLYAGDSGPARAAWAKHDEAVAVTREALDVDKTIRNLEHKIITIDSEIELTRRLGRKDPEREAVRRDLVRQIDALRASGDAHQAEGERRAKAATKLRAKAATLTQDALEATRRHMVKRIEADVREALETYGEIDAETCQLHAAVVQGGALLLREPEPVLDLLSADVWGELERRLRRTA